MDFKITQNGTMLILFTEHCLKTNLDTYIG